MGTLKAWPAADMASNWRLTQLLARIRTFVANFCPTVVSTKMVAHDARDCVQAVIIVTSFRGDVSSMMFLRPSRIQECQGTGDYALRGSVFPEGTRLRVNGPTCSLRL